MNDRQHSDETQVTVVKGDIVEVEEGAMEKYDNTPQGRFTSANYFSIVAELTEEQLQDVMLDLHAPIAKRACARMMYEAWTGDYRIRRWALREAMDRTEGKPVVREVSVQVHIDAKGPEEVLEEVIRLANYGMPE